MQNFKGAGFIKSYPALLKLPITVSEKSLMELVLSFTDNGNTFYMNYKDIAPYLGFSNVQSVKNVMLSLRQKGYVITEQSHNYNGFKGGSSTSIVINEDLINLQLKVIFDEENKAIVDDLNDNSLPIAVVSVSSKITVENVDKSLVFDFDKMSELSAKSKEISSLVDDFLPKENDFVRDENFYIDFENFIESVFNNVVLQRSDLKELYRNIKLDEVETLETKT